MSKVVDLAERIIDAGLVAEAQAVIGMLQAADRAAPSAVDPVTGEILTPAEPATDVTTEQPDPGALPEAVLDSFRQFFGAGSKHQWEIGRVVDDALVEFAGKVSANRIIRAAAKEMDLSRAQVLKCQTTWAGTDEQLRGEFDELRFEHFAAVVRHVKDRAQVRQWLTLATDPDAEFNGRFMPAAKLEAKIKQALGIGPEEPTAAELLERAIRAVTNYQAVASGRGHERATKALGILEGINEQ